MEGGQAQALQVTRVMAFAQGAATSNGVMALRCSGVFKIGPLMQTVLASAAPSCALGCHRASFRQSVAPRASARRRWASRSAASRVACASPAGVSGAAVGQPCRWRNANAARASIQPGASFRQVT